MNKYSKLFLMSLQTEFSYKASFIIWRLRNIISITIVYFLWNNVFTSPDREIFGYNKAKMLTYIFLIVIVKAFVLSSKAVDVAGEISRGDLSNYLVKPVSYFKYWLTKDLANKSINIIFAVIEFLILLLILKPNLYLQTDIIYLVVFLVSIIIALVLYFLIIFLVSSIPFWAPELGWGSHFLITVILVDFLSGSLFPLDILPSGFQKMLFLTPFPYLLYFPVQTYLGKLPVSGILWGLTISLVWLLLLYFLLKIVWKKGLVIYEAYGR